MLESISARLQICTSEHDGLARVDRFSTNSDRVQLFLDLARCVDYPGDSFFNHAPTTLRIRKKVSQCPTDSLKPFDFVRAW